MTVGLKDKVVPGMGNGSSVGVVTQTNFGPLYQNTAECRS